jgi:hypothetical protein
LAAVAPLRFVPLIVIVAPGHPLVGDIEVIVGETAAVVKVPIAA